MDTGGIGGSGIQQRHQNRRPAERQRGIDECLLCGNVYDRRLSPGDDDRNGFREGGGRKLEVVVEVIQMNVGVRDVVVARRNIVELVWLIRERRVEELGLE